MSLPISNPAASLAQQTQNEVYDLTHPGLSPQAPDPQAPDAIAPQAQAPTATPPNAPNAISSLPSSIPDTATLDPHISEDVLKQSQMMNGLSDLSDLLGSTQDALTEITPHLQALATLFENLPDAPNNQLNHEINTHLAQISNLASKADAHGINLLATSSKASKNYPKTNLTGFGGNTEPPASQAMDLALEEPGLADIPLTANSLFSMLENKFGAPFFPSVQATEMTLPIMLGITTSSMGAQMLYDGAGKLNSFFASQAQNMLEDAEEVLSFLKEKLGRDATTIELLVKYGQLKEKKPRKKETLSFEAYRTSKKIKLALSSQHKRERNRLTLLSNGYSYSLFALFVKS